MEYKYFTEKELRCPCCDVNGIHPSFMHKLELLREACDFPFVITSAYRCPDHNKYVGGAERSPHLVGMAADILVYGKKAHKLLSLAPQFGFTGIGISQKGDRSTRFIHLDNIPRNDPSVPRPWIWTY